MNELHTLANSSNVNKDHFQNYYQNFGQTEINEIKVGKKFFCLNFTNNDEN